MSKLTRRETDTQKDRHSHTEKHIYKYTDSEIANPLLDRTSHKI